MPKKILFHLTFILFTCTAGLHLQGAIELPAIFGDHMVLQRDKPIPVWGWSDEGQEVKVSFAGKSVTATAGKDGRWEVRLPAMKASDQERELTVEGSDKIILKDILVGEVWVCSGQSNMEWSVNGALNPNEETKTANHPRIRHAGF
jgi:sialate O-acetylesterase